MAMWRRIYCLTSANKPGFARICGPDQRESFVLYRPNFNGTGQKHYQLAIFYGAVSPRVIIDEL